MKILKRANIAAAIAVIAVLLSAGMIYTQFSGKTGGKQQNDQNKLESEADISLRQAISLGIHDWSNRGYSAYTPYWYCNYPMPPALDESNYSLHTITDNTVTLYLQNLRNENPAYYISDPDIQFDIPMDMSQLNLDSITALVSNFIVGLEKEDLSQRKDISQDFYYNYRVWLIYTKMYEWMQQNAGSITQSIDRRAIKASGCQVVTADCGCEKVSFGDVSRLYLTPEQVEDAIQVSVDALTLKFQDTGITCEYTVDNMRIENLEKTKWDTIGAAITENGEPVYLPLNPAKYDYRIGAWADISEVSDAECPQLENGVPGPGKRPDLNVTNATLPAYDPEVLKQECAAQQSEMMNVGMLAIDKRVAMILSIKCSDPSIEIESESGIVPLSSTIQLRISIAQDCPYPDKDINGDKICEMGNAPGGGGQAPYCPEPCPECFMCVDLGGGNYGCQPTPDTPCGGGGDCYYCNDVGQCVDPAPEGTPCSGECMVCDGLNTGSAGCSLFNSPYSQGEECYSIPCARCSGAGGSTAEDACTMPFDSITNCNDYNIDYYARACWICRPGVVGECEPADQGEREGTDCGMCATCSVAGVCEDPDPGELWECSGTCQRCSQTEMGQCEVDTSLDRYCGTCQMCGDDGRCVGDPDKNGADCGEPCKSCLNGQCAADSAKDGELCTSSYGSPTDTGCEWGCKSGTCVAINEGQSCQTSANTCGLTEICTGDRCVSQEPTKKCCGPLVCSASDPCCSVGGWTCEKCPGTT